MRLLHCNRKTQTAKFQPLYPLNRRRKSNETLKDISRECSYIMKVLFKLMKSSLCMGPYFYWHILHTQTRKPAQGDRWRWLAAVVSKSSQPAFIVVTPASESVHGRWRSRHVRPISSFPVLLVGRALFVPTDQTPTHNWNETETKQFWNCIVSVLFPWYA